MLGILSTTFRVATRNEPSRDIEAVSTRRARRLNRTAPDASARHPRLGLRPGEGWTND